MRNIIFSTGEFYHIYNRGTDKRSIFSDQEDVDRFLQSMAEFNVVEPINSIYENSFIKDKKDNKKLVEFIAFNLLGNHFHFILSQTSEKGIEKFMHRLGNGYTKYFNNKHKRTGSLFQGKYKAKHINLDTYLLHLSAYVNLNHKVHQLGHRVSKLDLYSSWKEYNSAIRKEENFCSKEIILDRFGQLSDYADFAKSSLGDILDRKEQEKELREMIIE